MAASAPHQLSEEQVVVPDAWHELADALSGERGSVIVIGGVDTGKSVLSRWLAEALAQSGSVGRVDTDLGQSEIGPPGTVGWRGPDDERDRFVFVGATTPEKRPLKAAAAARTAFARAAEGVDRVVVDTSGWVSGSGGVSLKRAQMDLLRPSHVVLIEKEPRELETIARAVPPGTQLHRLEPVKRASKSDAARRNFRRERFAEYLTSLRGQRVPLEGRSVYGGRPWRWGGSWSKLAEGLQGLLIGLSDADREGLVIGLLEEVTEEGELLHVLCPEVALSDVAEVGLGSIRLRADGTEIVQ
jgi:polynucleotide 5'-kinase involved in rRNA processing